MDPVNCSLLIEVPTTLYGVTTRRESLKTCSHMATRRGSLKMVGRLGYKYESVAFKEDR